MHAGLQLDAEIQGRSDATLELHVRVLGGDAVSFSALWSLLAFGRLIGRSAGGRLTVDLLGELLRLPRCPLACLAIGSRLGQRFPLLAKEFGLLALPCLRLLVEHLPLLLLGDDGRSRPLVVGRDLGLSFAFSVVTFALVDSDLASPRLPIALELLGGTALLLLIMRRDRCIGSLGTRLQCSGALTLLLRVTPIVFRSRTAPIIFRVDEGRSRCCATCGGLTRRR